MATDDIPEHNLKADPADSPVVESAVVVPPASAFTQPIVAAPDRKFFIKRMLIAVVVCGFAAFFLYDGFVRYPNHNKAVADLDQRIAAAEQSRSSDEEAKLRAERKDLGNPKSDFDLILQKLIGFMLLPVGGFLLWKFLRESSGEMRLENDTVHMPGHPPVPIGSITHVENARWDKKGIAFFDYKLGDGTAGRFKIDDFVFTRPPTDAIHDEILAKMPKPDAV